MSVLKRGVNPVSEQDKADIRNGIGLGSGALLNAPASGNASSGQVVKGDDTRLVDARTPTAHTHTAGQVSGLAQVATSGAYSDLSGRPTLGTAAATDATVYATAAQGTDAREWAAATVDQTEAEAGTSTTRRAWTAQRVWQAITKAIGGVIVTNTPSSGQVLKATSATTAAWAADETASGSGGANLSYTASPIGGIVASDSGTDAPLPLADGANAGLMAPAQHTKLQGIATGATANATDAQLRDRQTHTGQQAIATVTGLQAELDSRMPTGAMTAATAAVTVAASMNGARFKTTATQAFTVPAGLGANFVGVTVLGPCTWVAQGTTVTDRRQTGQGFDFCQLVQVANNEFVLVGTAA